MGIEKYKNTKIYPKVVHIWDVDGYVKISKKSRERFRERIRKYGLMKLVKELNFDPETIFSLYSNGRKKGIHSIKHLLDIAFFINYDLYTLEKEIEEYGRTQGHMYNFIFPFVINPLHFRAICIHGDGSFNKVTNQSSWYQKHENIFYMEKLLQFIFKSKNIKAYKKDKNVSSVTIPSILVYLICKSLDLELTKFNTIQFFKKISEISKEFQFQFFCQFIIDEGYFKDSTLTISQKKQKTRRGLIMLLDSLEFSHSNPDNNKDDITVYGFNHSTILNHLDNATNKYDLTINTSTYLPFILLVVFPLLSTKRKQKSCCRI